MIKRKKKLNHFNILFSPMFKFCILLFLFLLTTLWACRAFNQIDLNTYKNIKNIITQKISNNINKKINIPSNVVCNYFIQWDNYYISPWCFLKNTLALLWIKQTSNIVFPLIKSFDNIYDLDSRKFLYKPANPIFYYNYDLNNFISDSFEDKVLLYILSIKNYFIEVPKIFLAFDEFKNYSLYVSSKDLSKRNSWRLINFNIALNSIDNYILKPQEELNFNDLIAHKHWYFKKWTKKYLFYGGVCWVSTMLFRNVLINPYLYVLKRYNHSQRYVNYYSPYIYWDDASLYEYKKVLKIKNISDFPILFKKKQVWNQIYLISIVPKKITDIAYVSKQQIWPLRAKVKSVVFDKNGNILYKQTWVSNYKRKNYEN